MMVFAAPQCPLPNPPPQAAGLSGETDSVVTAPQKTRGDCDFPTWRGSPGRVGGMGGPWTPDNRPEYSHHELQYVPQRLACVAPELSPDSPAQAGEGTGAAR